NTHRIRLSETKTSPPIRAAAAGNYDAEGKAQITIVAAPEFKGKTVEVKEGDIAAGVGKFELEGGRAVTRLTLPKPNTSYPVLTVVSDNKALCTLKIPEPPR